MQYKTYYESPIGQIAITSDGEAITGLWLPKHNDFELNYNEPLTEAKLTIFTKAITFLDAYFAINNVNIDFELKVTGTEFRELICEILLNIPYGVTVTYGDIAIKIAIKRNKQKMSSQA